MEEWGAIITASTTILPFPTHQRFLGSSKAFGVSVLGLGDSFERIYRVCGIGPWGLGFR